MDNYCFFGVISKCRLLVNTCSKYHTANLVGPLKKDIDISAIGQYYTLSS